MVIGLVCLFPILDFFSLQIYE